MLEPSLPPATPSFAERVFDWRVVLLHLRDCWFCGRGQERGVGHLSSSPFRRRPSVLIMSDMGAAKVGEELSAPRKAHRLLRAHPSLGRTPRSHGRG